MTVSYRYEKPHIFTVAMYIDPKEKKMALVVIDVQKKFVITTHEDKELSYYSKLRNINKLAEMFRKAGKPVIFVKFIGGADHGLYTGEDKDEIYDEIKVEPTDIIVDKGHMNSFKDSGLDKAVKDNGCDAVLLCGTVTEYCVMSTYYAAFDYDLTPYIAKDACVSTQEYKNDAAYQLVKALDLKQVSDYLEGKSTEVSKGH